MKTIKIIFAIALFVSSAFLNAQIKVTNTGIIGIGTLNRGIVDKVTIEGDNVLLRGTNGEGFRFWLINNAFDLSPTNLNINGSLGLINRNYYMVAETGWFTNLLYINLYNYSDKGLKKNIVSIPYNRETFQKLNPVSYDMSDSLLMNDNEKKAGKKPVTSHQYGFIAQEIQELYPQLVTKDEKSGFFKVKPLELLPILVKAIQDQQAQINTLTNLVNNSNLTPKKIGANPTTEETNALTYPVLDQNMPNPFNTSTTIGYYLPTTISNASIYIYDMNGVQLKSFSITERGKGTVTIQGSEFNAGMYLYALIADGKVIDTKRMILTK